MRLHPRPLSQTWQTFLTNHARPDHVIVVNAAGLQRVLSDCMAYYLRSRTHLAIGKDTPITRPGAPPWAGRIVTTPEVGGLHHRYDRIAA